MFFFSLEIKEMKLKHERLDKNIRFHNLFDNNSVKEGIFHF